MIVAPALDETDVRHGRARFVDALRIRVFAVLYVAEAISIAGDQLARVALSVLVFDRTGSTSATALTYALTYVPAIVGGFSVGLVRGGRVPLKVTMVACEVARALLFSAMALHGMPLLALIVLLVVAVYLGPAFSAASVSYLSTQMDTSTFRAGTGLRMLTSQVAQVAGFATGGVLVAVLEPAGALLVNAATFVFSAVMILFGVARRSTAARQRASATAFDDHAASVASAPRFGGLWGDPRLRWLVALSSLAGFFVVPEALAVPLADDLGRSAVTAGLLLAALPLGGALGAAALIRWVPRGREPQIAAAMATCCGLPLVVTVVQPPVVVTLGCWFLSGLLAAYQLETTTLVVKAIPEVLRTAVIARASAILVGSQGVGLVLFGALAGWIGAAASVALAGACGSVTAAALATIRHRRSDLSSAGEA
ncbi:MFS transporter [uncultured Jatrophihabitans sp.]|uniref:MFS transporter n=1 Tax=uncultured Jatrophihabitans sp. TaxID=1610747 RepID=UPI0035CC0B1B